MLIADLNKNGNLDTNLREGVMKKFTSISIVLMFVLFLFGSASSAFASPPPDRAPNNQACQNASDTGQAHANGNSVLGNCGDEEPPADEPPADEPPTDPCLDPDYANANPDCFGGF